MKKNKYIYLMLLVMVLFVPMACKDQLDVGNPNAPTLAANVSSESGLISYAQGVVYVNGFKNGNGWLGDSYFSLPWGYAELLADNVGASAANNQVSSLAIPELYTLDDGTKVSNPSTNTSIIRTYNSRAATGAGNNALYYQWLSMYALNAGANSVLSLVDGITFSGDATSKANTVKAWAYWWKGYAYAAIGSMYYSGLIVDKTNTTSNEYVLHDAIIAQSNLYYNLAITTLQAITSTSDYTTMLGKLIPSFNQVGNGGVPSVDAWIRNINTMLARNILVNKLAPFVNGNPGATISNSSTSTMTSADWNSVLSYASKGIQKNDVVFTCRSTSTNYVFSQQGGTVSALSSFSPSSSTFTIQERFIQCFKSADKRLANNFVSGAGYTGNNYTTRWQMINQGNGASGVFVYANRDVGAYEVIMAGSYEENALMLAEANIRLGNIDTGLAYVDAVRTYFGAGIPAVSGTSLNLSQALTELVNERRVALVFRGLSFYDNRRWGWSYPVSSGGGRYGSVISQGSGTYSSNATISYNFMDYWDVPADEYVLNTPSATSAAIKNPNF